MAPPIFGIGTGPVNRLSIQIPGLVRRALQYGHAVVIGMGMLNVKVLNGGEDVPHGLKGLLFAESGQHSWSDISKGIAAAGVELGALTMGAVQQFKV